MIATTTESAANTARDHFGIFEAGDVDTVPGWLANDAARHVKEARIRHGKDRFRALFLPRDGKSARLATRCDLADRIARVSA